MKLELSERIIDSESMSKFINFLTIEIKNNIAFSENPMYDGFIIAYILKNAKFVLLLITDKYLGHVLDGTIQQLEFIMKWMVQNDSVICERFDKYIVNIEN